MNEFLKNLRGGTKDKRLGAVRTNPDRRVDVERRVSPQKRSPHPEIWIERVDDIEKKISSIEGTLTELKTSLLRILGEYFDRHVHLEERRMSFYENLIPRLETIFDKTPPKQVLVEEIPAPLTQKTTASPVEKVKKGKASVKRGAKKKKDAPSGKKISDKQRTVILVRIAALRSEGKSYEQITRTLVEEKLPTLSSRGQWHAQTVHRLCRNMDIESRKK